MYHILLGAHDQTLIVELIINSDNVTFRHNSMIC